MVIAAEIGIAVVAVHNLPQAPFSAVPPSLMRRERHHDGTEPLHDLALVAQDKECCLQNSIAASK